MPSIAARATTTDTVAVAAQHPIITAMGRAFDPTTGSELLSTLIPAGTVFTAYFLNGDDPTSSIAVTAAALTGAEALWSLMLSKIAAQGRSVRTLCLILAVSGVAKASLGAQIAQALSTPETMFQVMMMSAPLSAGAFTFYVAAREAIQPDPEAIRSAITNAGLPTPEEADSE